MREAKACTGLLVVLLAVSSSLGQDVRGLPCVQRFNQLYCEQAGFNYPMDRIDSFIGDNLALMRRMYGSLVAEQPPPVPEATPQTPASTTFVRSVRHFNGRFARDVQEGYLEDLLIDQTNLNGVDSNFSSVASEARSHNRRQRQAGFPGEANRGDVNREDACESRTEVTTPFWATNNHGQVRAIVNSKGFEQAVHQEVCSTARTLRCSGDCQCEQKYKWHRLLAYDPNNDCSGIFMDWFLFPSCCACRCLKNPLLQPPGE